MATEISGFPDIIRAVTDLYGLLALCVLVIGGLAYKMNADAAPNIRAVIFLAILASFVLCLYLAVNRGGGVTPPASDVKVPAEAAKNPDSEAVPPRTDVDEAPTEVAGPSLLFPDSDRRLLLPDEVRGLSRADQRLARNEVFARHGRKFRDPKLRRHFAQFDWYVPTANEVELNDIEARNVALIQRIERE